MQSLVRASAALLTLLATLIVVGCASRPPLEAKPAARGQFPTEEQKQLACLDLRDHVVALYADAYAQDEGLVMNEAERAAFRSGWAEQLAKRGTFERFEQSCFYSLTPTKYRCGMASQSTDGLAACMKLGALEPDSAASDERTASLR